MKEYIDTGRTIIEQSGSYPELLDRLRGLAKDMASLKLANGIGRQVRFVPFVPQQGGAGYDGVQLSVGLMAVVLPPYEIMDEEECINDDFIPIDLGFIPRPGANFENVRDGLTFNDLLEILSFF